MVRLPAWLRARLAHIEARGASRDLAFPWWIPVLSALGQTGCAVLAVVQRDGLTPSWLSVVAVGLVLAPHVLHVSVDWWLPWWLRSGAVLLGVGLLLLVDLPTGMPVDLAIGVMLVLIAEITVTDGLRPGLAVTALSAAMLFIPRDLSVTFHLLELSLGLVMGLMLRWQMRALSAERSLRATEHDRATLAERQRIAHDIHDLVGHSLSVTLLHLTGARRALADGGDPTEAGEALSEAERVGREAMTEIRRTVGLLAQESDQVRALPDGSDVTRLVADVRAAGLEVDLAVTGDPSSLPASVGLGVHRVVQESLANVVKHGRGPAAVDLRCGSREVRLRVSNPMRPGTTPLGTDGTGVQGLAWRARQLGGTVDVGPRDGQWVVDLRVPLPTGCYLRGSSS